MNRGYPALPLHNRVVVPPPIVVNDHDVLSGRGVNIAHHPGNQRFRTLVTTRADENYCTHYSASEKRAVAEEIIKHIKALDPPGRFLKRDTRVKTNSRGLNGPWIEISQREAIKKTCQALRDCNRTDREGYASGVTMPEDVLQEANQRAQLGLSVKQQAEAAVAAAAAQSQNEAAASLHHQSLKRVRDASADWGRVSPSVENAAEWLKKQRTDDAMATAAAAAAAVSADFAPVHDETVAAANAIYSSNDLLVSSTQEEDDIAEAAEVVASITAESNLGGSDDGTNMSSYRHAPYELSLSAPEEALAREMAASAGGLMSSSAAGAFNMNVTTSTTTTEGFNTTTSNTTAGGGYHESGGLNMHNMNEL